MHRKTKNNNQLRNRVPATNHVFVLGSGCQANMNCLNCVPRVEAGSTDTTELAFAFHAGLKEPRKLRSAVETNTGTVPRLSRKNRRRR